MLPPFAESVLIVGSGRMGTAIFARLRDAGVEVRGPVGHGATAADADVVLLAVPDRAIADAAAHVAAGRLVGHLSGASTLEPLAPHEAFSIHPLMTITGPDVRLAGVPAALAGSTDRALAMAQALADVLGMEGFGVTDEDRVAYHAAATMASNYLLTLEGAAEQLAATAGVRRAALVPLVRATVENWAANGARPALTGPVARGDDETVSRQRAVVAERLPERLALFDALTAATRDLATPARTETAGTQVNGVTVIRTITELQSVLRAKRRGGSIGFVPTMGALHEGHLSLLRAAREESDTVVLSIFVNPTQFDEATDLAAYPRTEERDLELAASAGVDIVFAPGATEMYPTGFATTVTVSGEITETLEGAGRGRAHFDGVATVVSKLLLAVLPDTAYFGAKDAQQVVVVRRAIADLNVPVRIAVCPTSRDPDGLARSSRNARLDPLERRRALAIPRALQAAADAVARGETDAAAIRASALDVLAAERLDTEYVAVVDPDSFTPVRTIASPALLVIAARVGAIRLIDNARLERRER